jgi:hypothetical protein
MECQDQVLLAPALSHEPTSALSLKCADASYDRTTSYHRSMEYEKVSDAIELHTIDRLPHANVALDRI